MWDVAQFARSLPNMRRLHEMHEKAGNSIRWRFGPVASSLSIKGTLVQLLSPEIPDNQYKEIGPDFPDLLFFLFLSLLSFLSLYSLYKSYIALFVVQNGKTTHDNPD